ncbi:hypothetical protein [Streptomyces sp. NBRC 110035]|uniref:hypothetical protein n=1 Tax=unclassified Streptomyces TaxID=2593676 RepID=UPI00351D1302
MRATVAARRDGDWVDADKDGCSTRNEVLLEEAVNAPETSGRCALTGGTWYSPYDDTYVDGARDLDHLVPARKPQFSGPLLSQIGVISSDCPAAPTTVRGVTNLHRQPSVPSTHAPSLLARCG